MKLSELNAEQLWDTLAEITVPIGNIVNDKKLVDSFKTIFEGQQAGQAPIEYLGAFVTQGLPLIFKGHKEDAFKILATMQGVSTKEAKKQSRTELFAGIKEIFSDKEFMNFFTSSTPTEKKP